MLLLRTGGEVGDGVLFISVNRYIDSEIFRDLLHKKAYSAISRKIRENLYKCIIESKGYMEKIKGISDL